MNKDTWDKSSAKKLFDCFMEIEKSQYPSHFHQQLDYRKEVLEKFILEFGVDHVTINNYTNMMQFLSSITVDVYDSNRQTEGSIEINIGSEAHEFWAFRIKNKKRFDFDFREWIWKEHISKGEYNE